MPQHEMNFSFREFHRFYPALIQYNFPVKPPIDPLSRRRQVFSPPALGEIG